jgi:transcriptional regulator with XRE-family HTH domain
MIDQVRTIVQASRMSYKAISFASNVSPVTIGNWLDGKVKKPQAATFNAVLRACGYKLSIRPIADAEVVAPTIRPIGHTPNVRHVVQIAKYRNAKKNKAAKRA